LRGDYFDNIDFTNLKVTRTDATVNFAWFDGSPDGQDRPDSFSVRWDGSGAGRLIPRPTRFNTVSDDGIRLWINGQLIINNWSDHGDTENSGTIRAFRRAEIRPQDGVLRERRPGRRRSCSGRARRTAKQVIPSEPALSGLQRKHGRGLTGEYFDNMDFTALRVTRTDATVNFDWQSTSPDASIGPDTFSVRWTGQVLAPYSQTYTFYTVSDDGIRLWVNGQLIINNWSDHADTENWGTIALSAGQRIRPRMEFYEKRRLGDGRSVLWETPSIPKAGGAGKARCIRRRPRSTG
jgi:hypothetical protein